MRKDWLMARIVELKRGRDDISVVLWTITVLSVIMTNINTYLHLSPQQFLITMIVLGTISLITIWVIGYLDIKNKFYSAELKYAYKQNPLIEETHRMVKELKENNNANIK